MSTSKIIDDIPGLKDLIEGANVNGNISQYMRNDEPTEADMAEFEDIMSARFAATQTDTPPSDPLLVFTPEMSKDDIVARFKLLRQRAQENIKRNAGNDNQE